MLTIILDICIAVSFRQNNILSFPQGNTDTQLYPQILRRGFDLLPLDFISNSLLDPYDEYFAGNRLVKQYRVIEEENHAEHDLAENYHQYANLLLTNQLTSLIAPLLTEKHGPVALGSGALGIVQAPSGSVYLGSGSLGYISHQQHAEGVGEILDRRFQISRPGPLSFGHRYD